MKSIGGDNLFIDYRRSVCLKMTVAQVLVHAMRSPVCVVNTDHLSSEGRRIKTALDVLTHVTRLLYIAARLHLIRNINNEFSQTGQCWKYNRRKAKPSYQPILNKIP